MSSSSITPTFQGGDYVKFFGAGALAATLTHGVSTLLLKVTDFR